MQTNWFCLMKKMLILNHLWLGKTDVRLSIWTQLSSFTTISNPGAFNHYASSAYEPNWLKSIFKFSVQKEIFGEVYLGVGTPKPRKKLSFNPQTT